ncbi:MAG: ribosome biogenesis GTP-binding protein YihA/YsxC [Chitinophagaceae bacterium]
MQIVSSSYIISSPDFEKCPKADRPEFAFIGRSNVGKSSLINMLTDKRALAKISATPGKTQLINHFQISSTDNKNRTSSWYLVDLPGYGFAKVSQTQRKSWEKMIEDYLRKRENLVNVFLLIDARHSPQENDLEFIRKLGKWQIPFSIIFTKSDKEKQSVVAKNVNDFLNVLKSEWETLPPYFVTSAIKRTGRDKILSFIENAMKM